MLKSVVSKVMTLMQCGIGWIEVEIEEDDTQNVNGIECQFLTN